MKKIQYSFVIRTLNEAESLAPVLERIHGLKLANSSEIIVIDSGSTDDTLKIAQNYSCKIITIDKKVWSWGRSLNWGIDAAQGEYIVVISAHCFIANNDFLERATRLFETNTSAVYGQQLPIPLCDPFEEYELAISYPNTQKYIMTKETLHGREGLGVSNACCVLKRSVWEKTKFNETISSAEDLAWALSVTEKNYHVIYSSDFAVYHSHPLNVDYVYTKHYCRAFETSQLANCQLHNPLRQNIKRFVFLNKILSAAIVQLKVIKDYRKMWPFLSQTGNGFITRKQLLSFLQIKHQAIIDGSRSYLKNTGNNYHKVEIPSNISAKTKSLKSIYDKLSTYYQLVPELKQI